MSQQTQIYTIGHSNHTTSDFIRLLQQHDIALLIDVRSQPYSRWAPQFNRETLAHSLRENGLAYSFMGDVLGGRPADQSLYDPGEERPNYRRMEQSAEFQAGIDRLIEQAGAERAIVMCSEGDHRQCHRHLLIAPVLLERGVRVLHVQPDGTITEATQAAEQLSLFG
jgi:uncharacterized protein (DUF488 family)